MERLVFIFDPFVGVSRHNPSHNVTLGKTKTDGDFLTFLRDVMPCLNLFFPRRKLHVAYRRGPARLTRLVHLVSIDKRGRV